MSAFDAEYEPSPWEPIAQEVERYERTNGTEPSELVGKEWIVLWTLGAKSGKVRKTPLVRVTDGDGNYAVIGSQGGAPTHPQWVHNVRANPVARLQNGATLVDLSVREAHGDEKAAWLGPGHRGLARLRRLPGRHRAPHPAVRPRTDELSVVAVRGIDHIALSP